MPKKLRRSLLLATTLGITILCGGCKKDDLLPCGFTDGVSRGMPYPVYFPLWTTARVKRNQSGQIIQLDEISREEVGDLQGAVTKFRYENGQLVNVIRDAELKGLKNFADWDRLAEIHEMAIERTSDGSESYEDRTEWWIERNDTQETWYKTDLAIRYINRSLDAKLGERFIFDRQPLPTEIISMATSGSGAAVVPPFYSPIAWALGISREQAELRNRSWVLTAAGPKPVSVSIDYHPEKHRKERSEFFDGTILEMRYKPVPPHGNEFKSEVVNGDGDVVESWTYMEDGIRTKTHLMEDFWKYRGVRTFHYNCSSSSVWTKDVAGTSLLHPPTSTEAS